MHSRILFSVSFSVSIFLFFSIFLSPVVYSQEEMMSISDESSYSEDSLESSEEILVTGSRLSSSLGQDMPGVTIITSEDIENLQPNSIVDLLRTVPSVTIGESGPGKLASVFIRGANSAHTMIMIDGVIINDPFSGSAPLTSLSLNNIDMIEIIAGPVSATLGFGGMGGVINIVTKQGDGKLSATANIETSVLLDAYSAGIAFGGGSKKFNYSLSYAKDYDNSISIYDKDNSSNDIDNTNIDNVIARIGFEPIENFKNTFFINYTDYYIDIDDSGSDNPLNTSVSRSAVAKYATSYLIADIYEPKISVHYTNIYFENKNDKADQYARFRHDATTVNTFGIDFQNNFYIAKIFKASAGVNYLSDTVTKQETVGQAGSDNVTYSTPANNKNLDKLGFYLEAQVTLFDSWVIRVAGRADQSNDKDFIGSYNVASVYNIKPIRTKVKASVGTGYNAATISQLYASYGANENLQDERSFGYQIGVSSEILKEILFLSLDWYDNTYTNLIDYDYTLQPNGFYNISKARIYGAEAGVEYYPLDVLGFKFGYAYTFIEDLSNNYYPYGPRDAFSRRPKNKFNVAVAWEIIDGLNVGIDLIYVGERPNFDTEIIDDYVLLNANIRYKFNDNIEVILKGHNITNTQYEEIPGYSTYGARVYLGANLKI